mmetsp:Transcript_49043/g.91339  ORF Transcript_49043/g.91339 Transcript_49043/m.91339 type:complete len:685 (+) Transcript_49043:456-2510(+)
MGGVYTGGRVHNGRHCCRLKLSVLVQGIWVLGKLNWHHAIWNLVGVLIKLSWHRASWNLVGVLCKLSWHPNSCRLVRFLGRQLVILRACIYGATQIHGFCDHHLLSSQGCSTDPGQGVRLDAAVRRLNAHGPPVACVVFASCTRSQVGGDVRVYGFGCGVAVVRGCVCGMGRRSFAGKVHWGLPPAHGRLVHHPRVLAEVNVSAPHGQSHGRSSQRLLQGGGAGEDGRVGAATRSKLQEAGEKSKTVLAHVHVAAVQAVAVPVHRNAPRLGQLRAVQAEDGEALGGLRVLPAGTRLRARLFAEREAEHNPVLGKPSDVRARGVRDAGLGELEVAVEDDVPEGDAEGLQEVVERGHVGTARGRGPPAARVVVKETHLHHCVHVVPVRKYKQRQRPSLDVQPEFLLLLRVVLLLRVHKQQGMVVGGVKAGERRAQHLHVVPAVAEMLKHVVEVGVRVVPVPVEDVLPDVEGVARDVAGRVAHGVVVVPQQTHAARGHGHHGSLEGHEHLAAAHGGLAAPGRGRHSQPHRAFGGALEVLAAAAHADVDGQVPGPRPQALRVVEGHLQVLAVAAGHKLRGRLQPPREAHAVEDGGVEDGGHGGVVERLSTVGPHVGARGGGEVVVAGHHACARLVGSQNGVRPEQVQLARTLLVDVGSRERRGRLHQRLLQHRRVEHVPALALVDHAA